MDKKKKRRVEKAKGDIYERDRHRQTEGQRDSQARIITGIRRVAEDRREWRGAREEGFA